MEKGIIVLSSVDISYYEDKLAKLAKLMDVYPEIVLVTPEDLALTTPIRDLDFEFPPVLTYPTKEKKPWSKRTPRKFGGIRTR